MNNSKTFLLQAIVAALLAVLGGFASQNWTPQISLTFLGMKSLSLPLAVWVLLAVLAGILTAVIISSLFGFSNYLTLEDLAPHKEVESRSSGGSETQVPPTTSGVGETKPPPESEGSSESGDRSGTRGFFNLKKGSPRPSSDSSVDDWNERPSRAEDWGGEGRPAPREPGPSVFKEERESQGGVDSDPLETNPRNYEADQKPKTESWSGSVYSYGYKDPSSSGVGQSESVYDADYRIITPPPKSESPVKEVDGINLPPKNEEENL